MSKIDRIAKRKELLTNGFSFDFRGSIDERGEVKSEEIWVKERFGFYIQVNQFNLKSKKVFDCFNEIHQLKQYKQKVQVIEVKTKEKFECFAYSLENTNPFVLGRCYWGRKKIVLSEERIKIEVELSENGYLPGTWVSLDNDWLKESFAKWDRI